MKNRKIVVIWEFILHFPITEFANGKIGHIKYLNHSKSEAFRTKGT